jgi:hypothetical protein
MFEMGRFEILAELSVAVLGFSGLLIALGHDRISDSLAVTRIRALLYTASASLVASVLPLLNLYLPVAAVFLLLALLMHTIWICVYWLRAIHVSTSKWVGVIFMLAALPISAWLVFSLLNQGASLGAAYIAGIGYFLLTSIYNFARYLLLSLSEAGNQSDG